VRDHESTSETSPDPAAPSPASTQLPFDPTQVEISRILKLPPSMRDAAISAMQQTYGNAYVQRALSQAPANPPAAPEIHPMLREGSNGPSVIELQQKLDAAGGTLATDGAFGPLTRTEVVRFQTGHALSPDGIVGPLTWAALDAQTSDTGGPSNLAVGDAETGGSTEDGLQTLDPDGPITSGASNNFGIVPAAAKGKGKMPVAPTRPPTVQNASKADLIAGGFANRGTYNPSGTGFVVPELDQLLGAYGAFWTVDVRAVPAPDVATTRGAGDSAGKGVSTQPPWVKALQNKIIGRSKWDDDDHATQRLIESFMRAWTTTTTNNLPPGAEQLMHQVGASETNGQAGAFAGTKGSSNWCAPASSGALIYGLYNRGIRFKTDKHLPSFGPEITRQLAAYTAWTRQANHVVQKAAAYDFPLEPGDIITVVNGGPEGPLSGHVATVVSASGDQITYISGNAAGVVANEGAVRMEEVKREKPVPDPDTGYVYDYAAVAQKGNAYSTAKQAESDATKDKDKDSAAITENVQWINEHKPVDLPSWNSNDQASVAGLIAFLTRLRPDAANRDELLAHAQTIYNAAGGYQQAQAKMAIAQAQELQLEATGDLPASRNDKRFKPGVHAPANPGSSWVVEVIRTGNLTKAQLMASGKVAVTPNDPALEQGPTLQQQCPDTPPDVINTSASSG
jgi:peptidoglycan hydrolase-like protein with peptidoglycan-binding domain